jgi:hypothetical protein
LRTKLDGLHRHRVTIVRESRPLSARRRTAQQCNDNPLQLLRATSGSLVSNIQHNPCQAYAGVHCRVLSDVVAGDLRPHFIERRARASHLVSRKRGVR